MGCCLNNYTFEDLFDLNFSKISLYNKEAYEIHNLLIKYSNVDLLSMKFNESNMNSRRSLFSIHEYDNNEIKEKMERKSTREKRKMTKEKKEEKEEKKGNDYKENQENNNHTVTLSNKKKPRFKKDLSYKMNKEKSFFVNLTETELQSIVTSYLQIENYESESLIYFNTIYKEIPYNLKYPIMKIILILLLSNPNSKEIEKILIENISFFSKYSNQNGHSRSYSLYTKDEINNSFSISQYDGNTIYNKIISKTDLYTLVRIYFLSITLICYNVFSSKFMEGNENGKRTWKEKENYKSLWDNAVINDYTKAFVERQKEGNISGYRIYDFIMNNFVFLLDKKEVRRSIYDYSVRRRNSNSENCLRISYEYKKYGVRID